MSSDARDEDILMDEIIESDFCSNCQAFVQLITKTDMIFDETLRHFFQLVSCTMCNKIFMYEYKELSNSILFNGGVSSKVKFIHKYPENEAITIEQVPKNVAIPYSEGVRCINANAPSAALVMFRKTLEQICSDKKSTKPTLSEQIDEIMPDGFQEVAHELRLWGNFGAHTYDQNPNLSIDDVEELLDFIDDLISTIYEYPSRLERIQNKRKKYTINVKKY